MSKQIQIKIQQAITEGNSKKLRECFYTLRNLMSAGTDFSSEDLDFLASLVEQQKFLDLGGGWYFVMLSQVNGKDLSFKKSKKIKSVISTAYDALNETPPEIFSEAIEQAIDHVSSMKLKNSRRKFS